jgi:predicted negative regulator of RcsB-dependent stress response
LRAYRDGELPLPQHEQLQRHLAQCPQCADELKGLDRVERLLADLSPVAAPDHLAAATLRRLRPRPSAPAFITRHATGLTGAVAAAACLLLAVQAFVPHAVGPEPTPLPRVAVVEATAPAALAILPATLPVAKAPSLATAMPGRSVPVAPVRRRARVAQSLTKAAVKTRAVAAAPAPSAAEAGAAAALNAVRRRVRDSDPDLMVAALENVALAYPGTHPAAQALLTAGDLQRRRGNLAEADANYRPLLGMKSADRMPQALAHKALADLRAESVGDDAVTRYHYQEAARVLQSEARAGAGGPQALLAMADIARETGNRAEAVADYAAAARQGAGEQAAISLAEVL